jgi:hypothetical protein
MTHYQKHIAEITQRLGKGHLDPRHIEAYIRLEHPTLNGLSAEHFEQEVRTGIACCDAVGEERAEALARSFGL